MDYNAALTMVREATAKFREVTNAYSSQTIGDEEYLAARREYEAAEKVYDRVYAETQFDVNLNAE